MVVFKDDFEQARLDVNTLRYWITDGTTRALSWSAAVHSGSRSGKFEKTSGVGWRTILADVIQPVTDERPFKAWVTGQLAGLAGRIVTTRTITHDDSAWLAVIELMNDQSIQIYNGDGTGFVDTGITWTAGVFREIVIVHHFEDDTFSVSIDGVLYATHYTPYDGAPLGQVQGFGAAGDTTFKAILMDDVELGSVPTTGPEASYLCQIGPYVIGTGLERMALNYNVYHEDNVPSEAWIEVENDIANLIEHGDQMKVWVIEWQETTYGQIFYGMVNDIVNGGPDSKRINARDALSHLENQAIDTVYGNIVENEELDINQGATPVDPMYTDLSEPYADINLPLTRVQTMEIDLTTPNQRPEDTGATKFEQRLTDTITPYNKAIAAPFTAEETRIDGIRIHGYDATTPSNAPYLWKVVTTHPLTGEPDLSDVIISGGPQSAGGGDHWFGFRNIGGNTTRWNIGRKYWLVIEPQTPGSPYDYRFYYSDPDPNGTGRTNAGYMDYRTGPPGWRDIRPDKISWMRLEQWTMRNRTEGEDYVLVDQGGTARIEWTGEASNRPRWFDTGATFYLNTVRAFYTHDTLDLGDIIESILDDIARVINDVDTGQAVPFVEAFETTVLKVVQDLMAGYGWRTRQIHRQESSNLPGTVRVEPLPSTGSPVLDLRHGDDAVDITAQARLVADNLRKQLTNAWTGHRLLAKAADGALLYYVQTDLALQEQFDLFNPFYNVLARPQGFQKHRIVKVRNAKDIASLKELADSYAVLDSSLSWRGNVEVDGSSWIVPGDTIDFTNSRRGIPETEFRVLAVEYSPNRMALTLSAANNALDSIIRRLNRELGKFGTLTNLDFGELNHNFYGYGEGRVDDTHILPSSDLRMRLLDSGSNPVSTWKTCQIVDGPVFESQTSKIVYCFFPAEDGIAGHGEATQIELNDPNYATVSTVPLTYPVYHWADNAVSICAWLLPEFP